MADENKSQKEILKSTSIVGGTQLFTILLGLVRTKFIAILLGAGGVGLIGLYQGISDLIRQLTGFGINFSGVKTIAESNASSDEIKISTTTIILRRWALVTGILGTVLMFIFSKTLSIYTFGNENYINNIRFLSISILFISISNSQIALLQGLREIKLMSKASIYGVVLGLIVTLPLYWILGKEGILICMILTSLLSLIISWFFVRDFKVQPLKISFRETVNGGKEMAKLGVFITASSIVATVTLYIIRSFLLKKTGISAVGCFQASWLITNIYLGTILNAMLADYFPRLTSINDHIKASNKLINEQLEISLLLGTPMLVGLITFASLIIKILYSQDFYMVIPVFQWQIAGTFFVFISWTIGVVFLAKNKGSYTFIIEILGGLIYVVSIYLGWDYFGFKILGIAYFFDQIFRLIFVYFSAIYLGKFKFSSSNLKLIFFYGSLLVLEMCNIIFNYEVISGYIISSIILMIIVYYSYSRLNKIIGISQFIAGKLKANK